MFIQSRPHMRSYTFVSFLLWSTIGIFRYLVLQSSNGITVSYWLHDIWSWIISNPVSLLLMIILLFYFLFPANLLIYWVNDIFDYETDSANKRKLSYEKLLEPHDFSLIRNGILSRNIPFLIAIVVLWWLWWYPGYGHLLWLLTLFIFFAIFYSAPPLRAKSVPFIDWLFKVVYLIPGIIGYLRMFGSLDNISFVVLLSGLLWSLGTHAFSAIPDIKADQKAKIATVATFLGKDKTLAYCAILYFLTTLLSFHAVWPIAIVAGIFYILLVVSVFLNKKTKEIFLWFPWLNTAALLIVFLWIAIHIG